MLLGGFSYLTYSIASIAGAGSVCLVDIVRNELGGTEKGGGVYIVMLIY